MRTRDQERALRVHDAVRGLKEEDWEDYKFAVRTLGVDILRSGLAAAMSGLERCGKMGDLLREHLAQAGILGLHQPASADPVLREPVSAINLSDKIRALPIDEYILATRETLQIIRWLTHATQETPTDRKRCETS